MKKSDLKKLTFLINSYGMLDILTELMLYSFDKLGKNPMWSFYHSKFGQLRKEARIALKKQQDKDFE